MWLHWELLLCHNLAILAWTLSILPKIQHDVYDILDEEKKAAMERGVEKLYLPPSPNKQVAGKQMETFWRYFGRNLNIFKRWLVHLNTGLIVFLHLILKLDTFPFGASLILYLRQRCWGMWLAKLHHSGLELGMVSKAGVMWSTSWMVNGSILVGTQLKCKLSLLQVKDSLRPQFIGGRLIMMIMCILEMMS